MSDTGGFHRFELLQPDRTAEVVEQTLPSPKQERDEADSELVDQAGAQVLLDHAGATRDEDVLRRRRAAPALMPLPSHR